VDIVVEDRAAVLDSRSLVPDIEVGTVNQQ
jgi:hypothetical protein